MMTTPIEQLRQAMLAEGENEAALIFGDTNRRYFTGFPSSAGALLVTTEAAYYLLDFRYAEAAQRKARDCQVVSFENLDERILELLAKHRISRVYFERTLSYGRVMHFETLFEEKGIQVLADGALDREIGVLRSIKTADEIKKLEASQEITDAAFTHILPFIKAGVTEREIALEIEFFMRKQGAQGVAFDLIVAAGQNGSMCHAVPSDYAIQAGDLITMDTGALLDGYHSDMTRTVALGFVKPEQKAVYELVLAAHLAVIDAVKPGVRCCDMDKVARDLIEQAYPGAFGHGLGHSVGMDIHEEPRFSKYDETVCQPGMVITDEPGIYLPGQFGVRIEDILVVTDTGCRSITKSKKELIVL